MTPDTRTFSCLPSRHERLGFGRLGEFPLLESVYEIWRRAAPDHLPGRLDPYALPRPALPFVTLIDLADGRFGVEPRVRLAGTAVCEAHGFELRGRTPGTIFAPEDAAVIEAVAGEIAATGTPLLLRRSYVTLADRYCSYVCLLLPMSREGTRTDRLLKVEQRISDADE